MQPLVLLALAALQAALVGALQLPVGVVVDALPSLGLPTPRTCAPERREAERSPVTSPGAKAMGKVPGEDTNLPLCPTLDSLPPTHPTPLRKTRLVYLHSLATPA